MANEVNIQIIKNHGDVVLIVDGKIYNSFYFEHYMFEEGDIPSILIENLSKIMRYEY